MKVVLSAQADAVQFPYFLHVLLHAQFAESDWFAERNIEIKYVFRLDNTYICPFFCKNTKHAECNCKQKAQGPYTYYSLLALYDPFGVDVP